MHNYSARFYPKRWAETPMERSRCQTLQPRVEFSEAAEWRSLFYTARKPVSVSR